MIDLSELAPYLSWDGLFDTLRLIMPVIGGIVAIRGYHWYKGIEGKDMRYRLANTLSVEVESIANAISPVDRYGTGFMSHRHPGRLDDTMYKGLVTSGGIAHFDVDVQELLYRFYGYLAEDDKGAMQKDISTVMDAVEGFKNGNTRRSLSRLEAMLGVRPQR